MLIPSVNNDCIWCGKRLIKRGSLLDRTVNFGPRPRSEEHIIPESIFGKILTFDLCKVCNDEFGASCDSAIIEDYFIINAAKKAGFSERDFWNRLTGTQELPSGRKVKVALRKGEFQPLAELSDPNKLSIPIVNGALSERHVRDFKSQLSKKVRSKKPELSEEQIRKGIDSLVDMMKKEPTATHHEPLIGETMKPSQLGSHVTYVKEAREWETQWCLAKIIFELSQTLWPADYRKYFGEALEAWRRFITARQGNEERTQGVGILDRYDLPNELPTRQHLIEGFICPTGFAWNLTFFGTARWSYGRDVEPIKPPSDSGLKIRIVNPVGNGSGDASIQIVPLT